MHYLSRLFYILSVLGVSALFIDIKASNVIIILMTAIWFLAGQWKYKWSFLRKSPYFFLCIAVFAWYVIGYFISENKMEAGFILEKNLALLVIPTLILSFPYISPINPEIFFRIFIFIALGILLYAFIWALMEYKQTGHPAVFYYHALTSGIGLSAIRASYLCLLSIAFLGYSGFPTYLKYAIGIFLILFLLLLASRLFLFIALCFFLLQLGTENEIRRKFLLTGIGALILAAVFFSGIIVKQRFSEFSGFDIQKIFRTDKFDPSDYFDGLSLRVLYARFGMEILSENNAFIPGVGTGDAKTLLEEKITQSNLYTGEGSNAGYLEYDFHNQYIQTFVRSGIIGLGLFLAGLIYCWVLAVKKKNKLFFLIMIMYTLAFCTDTWMDFQLGIVSYLMITSLLIRHMEYHKK